MTAAEQLAQQLRQARLAKGLSLRSLAKLVEIPASTLEGYEGGSSVPAEKLARIASALEHLSFKVDDYHFSVSRSAPRASEPDQLALDFTGEYKYTKANIKIGPEKITIVIDGRKTSSRA
jgi:transcriptional regulator with XRE-family HTH domain